jgi:hypothetical protein
MIIMESPHDQQSIVNQLTLYNTMRI